ncbi:SRPBCC family protein [Rhodobacter ferrooxidans]|uniref:Polyketide cyclase/dehydrase n=1 Tax=Rhodobacter ferrooxidans TaxID=371731 RepID=C8RWP0_9RHOB|nr:SRPBCC family protein [Rhodobacter sp. SW2]EEW26983.1 conserved hypothetical protein [Rhodobacter sp. SW2]
MKLSTREDIEAPLQHVFSAFADVEGWERAAMRRGASVVRTDTLVELAVGMAWQIGFDYRGKPRVLEARLSALDDPSYLAFAGTSHALEGMVTIDFLELGAKRTRVTIGTELQPRTLGARLFLQSLKLAKAKITRKYELRVAQVCTDIEDRYRFARR